jgi:hypothetical protein
MARFQIVPLGASGNGRVSQVCPSAPRIPKQIVNQLKHPQNPATYHNHFYGHAVIMYYMLRQLRRRTEWHSRLYKQLHTEDELPPNIDLLQKMGFPSD